MHFSKHDKHGGFGQPPIKIKRSLPLEPKGQNFSTHEKILLLDLISKHGRQLVDENDTLSIFRRTRIWRVVYTEFNQHQEVSQRTEKQLRLLWKNLKARCKREFRLNAKQYNTPGYVITDPLLRKMSTLVGIEGDLLAPVLVVRPNHETRTVFPPPCQLQVKLNRVNMEAPIKDLGRRVGCTMSDSNQVHTSPGPGTVQEQSRTGETSSSTAVRKVDELAISRRKKAIPRKASEAVKSEVIEIDDDIIKLEESEDICRRFYDDIRDNDSNTQLQSNGDGWLEDGPPSDPTRTYLQDEDPVCPRAETSHATVARAAIPQNNLHHHMPIRARKLIKIHSQHQERHLSDDYLKTVEDEGGEGALLHNHDQGHDTDLEGTETKECSALEKEMLHMARKEHDMKMTSMLMKRKQIMQIKRREHLAKMENYRTNKEILRLKKRKLELEIRNGLYLEEVEDDLDS
eukprot:XP_011676238.1 PREDICTED: uncharacterized protein LOC100893975 isoform X2 [Strongylocentrotus purpuratus]